MNRRVDIVILRQDAAASGHFQPATAPVPSAISPTDQSDSAAKAFRPHRGESGIQLGWTGA